MLYASIYTPALNMANIRDGLFTRPLPIGALTSEFPCFAALLGKDCGPPISSDCEIMMAFQGQHEPALRTHIPRHQHPNAK